MSQHAIAEPVVSARELVRVFSTTSGDVPAVRGVSLDILSGELLAIQGRSGSGKTTLLNLVGGLDRPTSGSVLFEGQDLTTMSERAITELRRSRVGFVFQAFGLLPLLSAYENVELPLRINGLSRRERRQRTEEALGRVGLGPRSRHRPYELSGGEQQRVAIARAVAVKPSVLLADEPTGDLDGATGLSIGHLLRDVAHDEGIAVVVATHDMALAGLADRVKVLVDGEFEEE